MVVGAVWALAIPAEVKPNAVALKKFRRVCNSNLNMMTPLNNRMMN
jgi:hypothetical protein